MLALALVGRLWHRWQQGRADEQALPCRSLPFDSTLARWPGVPEADTDMQRLVGEVQDRLGMQLLAARTLARTGDDLPGPARLMHLDQQLAQALLSLRLLEDRSQRSLRLRISDDGRGKPEGRRAEATARGIAMMERIASDLGAPLAIGPARPGWVVELTLKL